MVGIRSFPFGQKAYFQGRTVKLQVGIKTPFITRSARNAHLVVTSQILRLGPWGTAGFRDGSGLVKYKNLEPFLGIDRITKWYNLGTAKHPSFLITA